MKKVAVALVLVLTINILAFGSIKGFTGLFREWSDLLAWTESSLPERCLIGALRMEPILDQMEVELIEEIQRMLLYSQAKRLFYLVCIYNGARLGTEGIKTLNTAKILISTDIVRSATERIKALDD